jgi:mono/diheme cytochrome c family protein
MTAARTPLLEDSANLKNRGHRAARRQSRRTPTAIAVLTLTATTILGVGCGQSDSDATASPAGEVDLVAGEQTYMDFCGSCHGRDFEGSSQGPSQLDAVFAPEVMSDDDYRAAIGDGAPEKYYDTGPMPAIGSLDDQETQNVIAYVRQVQEDRGMND